MPRGGFTKRFFGWRVVQAAFVLAVCGLGMGFHGPSIYLHVVHETRGWPLSLISAAVTAHFLLGAFVTANLPYLYGRLGVPAVTKCGAIALASGVVGWSAAAEPWQLFVAAAFSGAGWVTMGVAAINAIVAPWFAADRPRALAIAYNGANIGGVIFAPLWVFAIERVGFQAAAAIIGCAVAALVWAISDAVLTRTPAATGSAHDEADISAATPTAGRSLWRDRRFVTLCCGMALGLFAQIGLIAHLYSVLAPALGARNAGLAMAWTTAMAVVGRTCVGWALRPGVDRRLIAAASYALQIVACVVLLSADDADVAMLLVGLTLYGLAFGNGTYLPPLIAQVEFAAADVSRAVALSVAVAQGAYAFAPAALGVIRQHSAENAALSALGSNAFIAVAAIVQALAIFCFLLGRSRR